MRRHLPSHSISLLLIFLIGLLGSACGASTGTTSTGSVSATATATIAPTATPLATIPAATVTQVCGQYMPTPAVSVGGLAVVQQTGLGNLAYPATKLPDNAAQVPMVMQQSSQGGFILGPDDSHPTNPNMHEGGGGYAIWVCNISSAPHTISRVDVRLESVAPYTAQLNEWPACQSPYTRQFGPGGAGCGGADFENEYMHAPFTPDATPGTVVTATQTGTNTGVSGERNYGPLPVTLQPGERMSIEVGMGSDQYGYHAFSTAGTYTFSFGLSIDDQTPIFATTSPPTLLATPAHEWNGQACTTPAMQAQIPPATDPPTYYICPVA